MYFSQFPYHLDPDEFVLMETDGVFEFPDDAPQPFNGRKAVCGYTLTNHAIQIHGTIRKLFKKDDELWGLIGLDQIKKNGREPVSHRSSSSLKVQLIGENEPVVFVFNTSDDAADFNRHIWDQITHTSELERNFSSATKTAANVLTSFAGTAAGLLSETGKSVFSSFLNGAAQASASAAMRKNAENSSRNHQTPPVPQSDGETRSLQEHLSQLQDLYKAGILSKEEYERKSMELIEKYRKMS